MHRLEIQHERAGARQSAPARAPVSQAYVRDDGVRTAYNYSVQGEAVFRRWHSSSAECSCIQLRTDQTLARECLILAAYIYIYVCIYRVQSSLYISAGVPQLYGLLGWSCVVAGITGS